MSAQFLGFSGQDSEDGEDSTLVFKGQLDSLHFLKLRSLSHTSPVVLDCGDEMSPINSTIAKILPEKLLLRVRVQHLIIPVYESP